MSSNTWLNRQGLQQIDNYLNSQDVILVERNRSIKLIIDILNYHFQSVNDLNILDLGCGNGIITKKIHELYPNNKYYLYDGSEEMLNKAKNELKNNNFIFKHTTFENYIVDVDNDKYFDFIFSSMAIHHLNLSDKIKLYEKIYRELNFNGLFLNFDVVKPETIESEKIQFNMWTDWMNEKLILNNCEKDLNKHNNLPSIYKNKAENKPSTLSDNLKYLKEVGFNNVDCFFKYSIFTLYGGMK